MTTSEKIQAIIADMREKRIKVTRDNIITQSLFFAGGTLGEKDGPAIDRALREIEFENELKKMFRHLSNQELLNRANGLPDFKWDDEGAEISRRVKASNGKLEVKMVGSRLQIIKDETAQPCNA